MKNDGQFVIDEDELSDRISAKLSIDADQVSMVLDAEMAFLESKGLVIEEQSSHKTTSKEAPIGEIDRDLLVAFVVSQTSLAATMVEQILAMEATILDEM